MEYIPNKDWGYLMRPSQIVSAYGHSVYINKAGLRGPEIKKHKTKNVLRILLIGNSIVYGGLRIREENLFCRITESMLNKNNYKAEIINLSALGWSPQNWIKYIETNGFFDADLVVLILPECDLGRKFGTMEDFNLKRKAPFLRLQSIVSRLYVIVKEQFSNSDNQIDRIADKKYAKVNINAILKLINLCKVHNIEFFPVLIPTPASKFEKYWPQFENILPYRLDLRDKLPEILFYDSVHLNAEGHRAVSKRLHERLRTYMIESGTVD